METTDEFERFYADQYPQLARVAFAMCANREDAQDIAQEALARVLERWEVVRHYDVPEAFARRVLINLLFSRTRRRRVEAIGLFKLRPGSASRDETELSDSADAFWQAVRALPRRQAQVALLRWGLDLQAVQIAEILDIEAATVRSHLHDARARLERTLRVTPDSNAAQRSVETNNTMVENNDAIR